MLKILSRRPRLHGYAIMSAIQDMSSEVLHAEIANVLRGDRLSREFDEELQSHIQESAVRIDPAKILRAE